MGAKKEKSPDLPYVTVIMPVRNEASHIQTCLGAVLYQDYPPERLEIIVADGMSTDGTRELVNSIQKNNANVRLIENREKIVSHGLNVGLKVAKGELIIIVSGHCQISSDYVSRCVNAIQEMEADAIGGICVTRPGNDRLVAKAIALGLSHPFGVGNSYFRIGSSKTRWVDTVPFGCYRREIFAKIGIFDEDLVRNQDDEFNLRIIKNGGRILLDPQIISYYYARESISSISRMFYQYGYFKPLLVRKLRGVFTLRQLFPPGFVMALLFSGILGLWSPLWMKILTGILLAYSALVLGCAATVSLKRKADKAGFGLILVFPIMHLSYGFGYLKGLIDFFILRRRNFSELYFPISR